MEPRVPFTLPPPSALYMWCMCVSVCDSLEFNLGHLQDYITTTTTKIMKKCPYL